MPPGRHRYPFEVDGDTHLVVLLGIDVHEGTHTAVAVDEVGQKIGQCVVAAPGEGMVCTEPAGPPPRSTATTLTDLARWDSCGVPSTAARRGSDFSDWRDL